MKTSTLKRTGLLVVLAWLVSSFFIFDLGQYFTLEYVKNSQAGFEQFYMDNQVQVIAAYALIYIVTTALSLPGAAVLTLLGGAIFGFILGTVIVSFASSIGATLACGVSRFMLRDWVQGKFGQKLEAINKGIEEEGAFYLFTLRLIPIFPFFVINLAMGMTKMKLTSFYLVSQVGMLAGTMVFVNAGRELGKIETLSGILSPGLIISFALIGLLPLVAKKSIAAYRKKRGFEKKPSSRGA